MTARFVYRSFKSRLRDQRQEIKALLKACAAGDTAVDIGANKGSYIYWMSRAVARTGRVVAFEPQPNLAAYLSKAVTACGLKNVVIEQKAVSGQSGEVILHVPGESSPEASLETHVRTREGCRQVKVEAVRLDDYFLGYKGRISVIKVDVEGHELSVFRGARRIIMEHSPMLIFETENRHLSKGTVLDVLNYLKGIGYDGSFVFKNSLLSIEKFVPELHQSQAGERFWDRSSYCNNFIMQKD